MKEENILLPGEANFTDEDFTLMKMLLEDHLAKVQIIIQKINHLQREEEERKSILLKMSENYCVACSRKKKLISI